MVGFDRKPGGSSLVQQSLESPNSAAPGKRTLVEQLPASGPIANAKIATSQSESAPPSRLNDPARSAATLNHEDLRASGAEVAAPAGQDHGGRVEPAHPQAIGADGTTAAHAGSSGKSAMSVLGGAPPPAPVAPLGSGPVSAPASPSSDARHPAAGERPAGGNAGAETSAAPVGTHGQPTSAALPASPLAIAAPTGYGHGSRDAPPAAHPQALGSGGPAAHAAPSATAGHAGASGSFEELNIEGGPAESPSPEAAAAVEHQVHASAQAERARLSALLGQKTADIDAHVASKHQEISAAAHQHMAEVRASAQAARARVTGEITQAHARMRSDAQAKRQGVQTWHTTAHARLADGVRTRQDRARQLGDTHARNLNTAAGTAALRAQTGVGAKAQQARDIGQSKAGATGPTAEATEAKRKAANDISNDSASKITGGLGSAVSDIHQTGRDAGAKFKQDADAAASQLGTTTPQAAAHLSTQRDQAIQQIAQAETQTAQAITQAHGQFHQQIATAEQQHLHQLQTAHDEHSKQIAHAGRQAVTTLRNQGDKALAAGDHSVTQMLGKVRQISISRSQAKPIGDHLVNHVTRGFGSLHTSIDGGAHSARGGLDQAAAGAKQSFVPIGHGAAKSFGDLTAHAQTNLHQQTTQAGTQFGHIEAQVKTSGDQGVDTLFQGLDQQIATVDRTFADKAVGVAAKMDDQATSAVNKAGEPVGTVGQRIDEAHARIDAKAQESQKGWLERQFDSLVNMLTDPGFWAALVVGLVLAVVVVALLPAELTVGAVLLGIAAMAVVGALAAGVGTVVSNLCAGRPWDTNLGSNMLIGALFGGVLFAAALVLPEGILGYLGLAGVAGVLTVISNLATGRPWDEGLLANMLLVGLLSWLGKFLPRVGKGGPGKENPPPENKSSGGNDPNGPPGPGHEPNQPPGQEPPGQEPPTKVTGETDATRIGKQVHKTNADARRASGDWDDVNTPIKAADGSEIRVPKRVNLKTGEPAGDDTQVAQPDAVSYSRGEILDDKPADRPISKDRQEMIRNIEAYRIRTGTLPNRIIIERYDPKTGAHVKTEVYPPSEFLP